MDGWRIAALVCGALGTLLLAISWFTNRKYQRLMDTPQERWPEDDIDWARQIGWDAYLTQLRAGRQNTKWAGIILLVGVPILLIIRMS